MRKKLYISAFTGVFILLVIIIFAFFKNTGTKIPAVIYCPDKSMTTLVSARENIKFNDPAQIPLNIINKLKSKRAIPRKCSVHSVTFDTKDTITVDFSEEFLDENHHINILRVYAVVKSICSTSSSLGITGVKVTVDGKTIKTEGGTPLSFLSDSSINIMNSSELMTFDCSLYFLNKNGELEPETRKIDAANGKIEYNVIKALIDGPGEHKLTDVFVSGTKLASAETVDGICYVNFEKLPKSSDYNTIRSSLIYTLGSLNGIEDVQILLGGKIYN